MIRKTDNSPISTLVKKKFWNMVQRDEEGTEVRQVSTESQQFGDTEAEATYLEIQLKEPYFFP